MKASTKYIILGFAVLILIIFFYVKGKKADQEKTSSGDHGDVTGKLPGGSRRKPRTPDGHSDLSGQVAPQNDSGGWNRIGPHAKRPGYGGI